MVEKKAWIYNQRDLITQLKISQISDAIPESFSLYIINGVAILLRIFSPTTSGVAVVCTCILCWLCFCLCGIGIECSEFQRSSSYDSNYVIHIRELHPSVVCPYNIIFYFTSPLGLWCGIAGCV